MELVYEELPYFIQNSFLFYKTVNGGYSDWSDYGECSVTCGEGSQQRDRKCNNPSPKHGGLDCVGENTQSRSCKEVPCPGNFKLMSFSI